MKKLMIAAAIVCAAALSQAASVSWTTDAFYIPADALGTYSTSTKTANGKVNGYLWEVDSTTYAKFFGESATLDVWTEYGKTDHGALGTTTKEGKSGMSRNVSLGGTTDWGVGSTAYGIVLYTYNDGKDDWYVANGAKFEGMDAADATVSKLNLYKGGYIDGVAQGAAITGWTAAAVPEPTSGLLLLLGVAGLALRRRRA